MPLKELLFSSKGRIPRSTWWYFRLAAAGVMVGVSVVVIIILVLASGAVTDVYADSTGLVPYIYCLIAPFWLLFIFFDIMVSIKRCHDRNRSGWFLLWSYAPRRFTQFSAGCS